ncbi:pre-RNA processing PIH1/Nop17-domain-containing protein [Tribonema minus]|uniref:Pre-RNA processing PIH1/Nop17-domain-containing protein n=1 Tax=Tribonema minus TaxID=303371 RepID=A0A835ZG52_9STRA|nr:pre-RNA processing PIH1/Nop17-domain-containing protein [Tribonema minus]
MAAAIGFAAKLAALQQSDPEAFAQLAQLASGDAGSSAQGPASGAALLEALAALEAAGESRGELDLPGGGVLGETGVKQKDAGVKMTPDPGFVVKTKELDTGCKVFLNVCSSDLIGVPGPCKRLDEDTGEEVEVINMPVSVGPPREYADKAGGAATVYDVVVNPKVLEEVDADRTGAQRDFVCHMAREYVERKHKCRLDERYKLPKTTIPPALQRVRDTRNAPVIQEVPQPQQSRAAAKHQAPPPALPPQPLKFWVRARRRVEDADLEDVTGQDPATTVCIPPAAWPHELLIVVAGLREEACAPGGLQSMMLKLSVFELLLEVPGHDSLSVLLPYAVRADSADARVDPHLRTLTVRITVDATPPELRPDPGSRPWLLAEALRRGDDGGDQQQAKQSTVASHRSSSPDGATDPDDLPEDRFHLRLPKGVNKYSGELEGDTGEGAAPGEAPLPPDGDDSGNDALPEDKFHKQDIVSQHYIESRDQQRREKIDRADRERAERLRNKDPGVEYVDFDDYRPGGKFAAPSEAAAAPVASADTAPVCEPLPDTVLRASQVLQAAVRGGGEGGAGGGRPAVPPLQLSSTLWSELLD